MYSLICEYFLYDPKGNGMLECKVGCLGIYAYCYYYKLVLAHQQYEGRWATFPLGVPTFAIELPLKGAHTMMDWVKELSNSWKGAMKLCKKFIKWEELSNNVTHMLQEKAKRPKIIDSYLKQEGFFLIATRHRTLHWLKKLEQPKPT